MHSYHAEKKRFPTGVIVGATNTNLLSFHVYLLPYMGMQSLYMQFSLNDKYGYAGAANQPMWAVQVGNYQCPASMITQTDYVPETYKGTAGYTTHYYGSSGPKGTNPKTGQPYGFFGSSMGGEAN